MPPHFLLERRKIITCVRVNASPAQCLSVWNNVAKSPAKFCGTFLWILLVSSKFDYTNFGGIGFHFYKFESGSTPLLDLINTFSLSVMNNNYSVVHHIGFGFREQH